MQKTIITYGLIAGAVIAASVSLSLVLEPGSEHLAALEWLGYAVMIVAFSVIFVAIKGYRDREQGGVITFGTAFRVGIGVTLIASMVYVVAWEINLSLTDYAFIDEYAEATLANEEAAGATQEELSALGDELDEMKARYANPLFRVPITLLEIFPVGLLVTLISAAVLRNSRVLPESH